jgi:hypothetical protein
LSGNHAHLNGKRITWEVNHAYGDPTSPWVKAEGKIVRVDGDAYYVSHDGCYHWVDAKYGQYRNIVVESSLDRIIQNMEGWSDNLH